MLQIFPILTLLFGGPQASAEMVGAGDLVCRMPDGKPGLICPLEGTKVNADVAGYGARVTVVQTFTNPSKTPIEAIYTFPLPADAAVDRMRIRIGDRIINATIHKREDARVIYEEAKNQGKSAALLDQERPNVFTQSVANIMPGKKIEVEISYVQVLKYQDGGFEFSYPMVVGPRYLGNTKDADKINPPILPPNVRSGATIELNLNIDAGAPIRSMNSVLHEVNINRQSNNAARISLKKKDEMPNRDFIFRYGVAEDSVKSAFLTHADPRKGGFFTLILLPPKAPTPKQISPREMIFVIDQSGSQSGFPILKSKELSTKIVETLRPGDTFNVMGFSNDVNLLWPTPRPVNEQAIKEAKSFIQSLDANGGTELYKAINAALAPAEDPVRPRYIVFNTDGYIGNELQVIQAIQKGRVNSRVFTFGIGNGVNTYLINAMSAEGKGDNEIVTLDESADPAVKRFQQRIDAPVLTNIEATFSGEAVTDVLPTQIPDCFSQTPVILKGRYSKAGKGKLVLNGRLGGQPWSTTLELNFPSNDQSGSAIASIWAREKINDIFRKGWIQEISGEASNKVADITDVALEFGIMSEYTSFVAVEQRIVNVGGKQRTVNVPVEMVQGVTMGDVRDEGGMPGSPTGGGGRARGGGGGGTGGFGGPGGPPPANAAPRAMPAKAGLSSSADSKAEGLSREQSTSETDRAKLPAAERTKLEDQIFQSKVDAKLRNSKANELEVQIWVADLKPETLAKLTKLGLKVDASDSKAKIIFGRISKAKLRALSLADQVEKIVPL